MTCCEDPTEFSIGKGDTAPPIEEDLFNADDTPINGTGATVRFELRSKLTGQVVVDAGGPAASIVTANPLRVRYDWQPGDTDEPGTFYRRWKITLPSTLVVHVPNDRLGYPTTIT